jgi:uncharacterized membrane protein YdcZ (DUF606 family)
MAAMMLNAMRTLLVLAVGLPVVHAVLTFVSGLLGSMGDAGGAAIVRHVGTACLVAWAVSLVGMLILMAIVITNEKSQEPRVKSREPEEVDIE